MTVKLNGSRLTFERTRPAPETSATADVTITDSQTGRTAATQVTYAGP